MNISFIGYGAIAQAMTKPLLHHLSYKLRAASPSLAVGLNAEGVFTHNDNLAILKDADLIIIAVKPKWVADVLVQVKEAIPAHALLISLAAGLSLSWLEKYSAEKQAIVRAMPNTPVAVRKGATALMANPWVSFQQKAEVSELFQSMGIITWIDHEEQMDALTALSGSGPAYVFLFLEALIHGAEQLGLPLPLAKSFALQMMNGAIDLVNPAEVNPAELRKKVTSSGGTTAAALGLLQEEKFEQIIHRAMQSAFIRAKELGLGVMLP